jgi:hypothetical protein
MELVNNFNTIVQANSTSTGNPPVTSNKRVQHYLARTQTILNDVGNRLQEISNGFEYQVHATPSKVQKRQVLVLLAGALIGSAVTSLFTQFSSQTLTNILKQKVDVIAHKVEENSINIAQNSLDIQRLNYTMHHVANALGRVLVAQAQTDNILISSMIAEVVEAFSQRINKLQIALDSIYLNKFHRDLASTQTLWQAMAKIKDSAFKKGLLMGVHTLAELYQLPASFLYDKDTATINIIVHVPLYYEAHVLTLYRYVNTPIRRTHRGYFEIRPLKTYLARNRDGTLTKSLTEEELADCISIGHTYFCNDKALRKRSDPTCLNALFDGVIKSIIRECPVKLTFKISELTKVGLDRYLVAESHPMRIMSDCPVPGAATKTFAIDIENGTHIITVDPNCTTTSENWVIAATTSIDDVHVDSVNIPNKLNIQDFIGDVEPIHMDLVLESLKDVGQPIPLEQVKGLAAYTSQLQAIDRKYAMAGLAFTATGSLTAMVIIGILIFCGCKGKCDLSACSTCCKKSPQPHHSHHRRHSISEGEESIPMQRRHSVDTPEPSRHSTLSRHRQPGSYDPLTREQTHTPRSPPRVGSAATAMASSEQTLSPPAGLILKFP